MPDIREGNLSLVFPDDWQAIKYDESDWHCQRMKNRPKAMDILARNPDEQHWWIEIKDCEGYEKDNRPRISPSESGEVDQVRQWIKQQGWQQTVHAQRKKPFIVDEVEAKLKETLAALAIARRENHAELAAFDVLHNPVSAWKVVLLLTWEKRDFKRLATRLQQKLNRALSPYGVQGFVVNEQTTGNSSISCLVTRSNP